MFEKLKKKRNVKLYNTYFIFYKYIIRLSQTVNGIFCLLKIDFIYYYYTVYYLTFAKKPI